MWYGAFSNQVRGIFSSFGLLSSLARVHPSSALLGHQVHTIVLLFLHLEIYFPLNRDLQKCTSLWLFMMTATPVGCNTQGVLIERTDSADTTALHY